MLLNNLMVDTAINSIIENLPSVRRIGLMSGLPDTTLNDEDIGPPKEFLKEKDNYIFLMFSTSENFGLAYICISGFRKIFNRIILHKNEPYISTADMKYRFLIPTNSSIGKKIYTELDINMIHDKINKSSEFVPPGLRDKYCICFADRVFSHADTLEEAQYIASTQFSSLYTSIYIPPKRENLIF